MTGEGSIALLVAQCSYSYANTKVSFQRVTLESQKKDDVIRVADTGMTKKGALG